MSPLRIGDPAPAIPGVRFGDAAVGLFFFKVTCPTCQIAAPTMGAFHRAFPGSMIGIGQDPGPELERFATEHDMGVGSIEDSPPYPISDRYEIVSVPTLYLIGRDGTVSEMVGAWDRAGFNRVAARLADDLGLAPIVVSTEGDGRPGFKPG